MYDVHYSPSNGFIVNDFTCELADPKTVQWSNRLYDDVLEKAIPFKKFTNTLGTVNESDQIRLIAEALKGKTWSDSNCPQDPEADSMTYIYINKDRKTSKQGTMYTLLTLGPMTLVQEESQKLPVNDFATLSDYIVKNLPFVIQQQQLKKLKKINSLSSYKYSDKAIQRYSRSPTPVERKSIHDTSFKVEMDSRLMKIRSKRTLSNVKQIPPKRAKCTSDIDGGVQQVLKNLVMTTVKKEILESCWEELMQVPPEEVANVIHEKCVRALGEGQDANQLTTNITLKIYASHLSKLKDVYQEQNHRLDVLRIAIEELQ